MSASRGASDRGINGSHSSWPAIGTLVAAGIFGAALLGRVPPITAALRAELGVSLATVGWMTSIITLGGAIFGVAAGSVLGAIKMKTALIGALFVSATASALGAVAAGPGGILFARALEGVGYLVITIACPTLIAHTATDATRTLALAFWGCFLPLGLGVANLISPVVASVGSWRLVFGAGALAMLAMALAVAATPMRAPEASRGRLLGTVVADYRAALGHPPALIVAGVFFWFAGLNVGFLSILPTWLSMVFGLSAAVSGQIAAIAAIAYILGAVGGGWLLGRGVTPWRLGATGFLALAAFAALALVNPASLMLAAAAAIALNVAVGAIGAVLFAGAPSCAPARQGTRLVIGLYAQAGSTGVLLLPPILAIVAENVGWPSTLVVFVGGSLCACSGLWAIRRSLASA